jgi:hypothetical protein
MRELVLYNIHPGVFLGSLLDIGAAPLMTFTFFFYSFSCYLYTYTHRELKCHGGISFFFSLCIQLLRCFFDTHLLFSFFLWEASDVVRLHHQPQREINPFEI